MVSGILCTSNCFCVAMNQGAFSTDHGGCVSTHLAGKKVEILTKGVLESGDENQPRFTAKILLKSW